MSALEEIVMTRFVPLAESGPRHVVCGDCGPSTLHNRRCSGCGGDAWVPASAIPFNEALRLRRERQQEV